MNRKDKIFQIVLCVIFCVLCILIVFPFWLLISASLSDSAVLAAKGYQIWPNPIDFSSYAYVFKHPEQIMRAYGVTFVFSVVTMVLSVLLMAMIAYPISQRDFKAKNAVNFYLYFTMLFSGGLVPTYIVVAKLLHLNDTLWAYILPGLISPWYVFMMRTFFQGIPAEIMESATIDGASEYTVFFKMILPLSKTVLATVALFYALTYWNDWYLALLYIDNDKLLNLQSLLQRILKNIALLNSAEAINSGMVSQTDIPTEGVRMAMCIIAAGPMLVVFPFFQKYFVQGLTVGSVKG